MGHFIRIIGLVAFWFLSIARTGVHLQLQQQLNQQQQQTNQQQQLNQLQRQLQTLEQLPPNGQESWMLSSQDIGQNITIKDQEHHLEVDDAKIDDLNRRLSQLERDISKSDATASVWDSLLSVMVCGLIGFQVWKKNNND